MFNKTTTSIHFSSSNWLSWIAKKSSAMSIEYFEEEECESEYDYVEEDQYSKV